MPLFLSRRRLAGRKSYPRARGPWALDSGGFSELSLYGRWTVSAGQYIAEVRRFAEEIGNLQAAFQMDHMCEPSILASTGRSIADHQRLTTNNYLELVGRAPDLPWVPVLQGWSLDDYLRHAERFEQRGIALASLPLVGVGTLCRRQAGGGVVVILRTLAARGIRVHAFGVKRQVLPRSAGFLVSADSLAWSYAAKRGDGPAGMPRPSCQMSELPAVCPALAVIALAGAGRGRPERDRCPRAVAALRELHRPR